MCEALCMCRQHTLKLLKGNIGCHSTTASHLFSLFTSLCEACLALLKLKLETQQEVCLFQNVALTYSADWYLNCLSIYVPAALHWSEMTERPEVGHPCLTCMQADTVIITNQNQRSEDPNQIVQDIISGFPEDILEYNAKKPWPGGILQDVQRPEYTLREFVMEGQNR